jgi:F0F1-type ATP synthase assembly protein I
MGLPDPPNRHLGHGTAMAQIGFEMAAPIGLGVLLDRWLEWSPWLTIVGAVVGLVGGIFHLVVLANREDVEKRRDEVP